MQKYDIVDYDYLKIILKDYTILNHHKKQIIEMLRSISERHQCLHSPTWEPSPYFTKIQIKNRVHQTT